MLIPYCVHHATFTSYGGNKSKIVNLATTPSPCIAKCGIFGDNLSHYHLEWKRGDMSKVKENKPLYKPLTMKMVKSAEKKNGYSVASFFSGGGGSSLGYKLAGFDVKYACEFWDYAANTYEANSSIKVDRRSICDVTAKDVLKACGCGVGELDILDGSPPCQTFSTAGKRDMQDDRTDLFFEWLRILEGVMPRAFVSENVSGMVKGVAKGQFKRILKKMKSLGYRVEAKLLDAQWLGVPQQRQRIIFIGIHESFETNPVFPKPLKYRYSVADACPWMSDVIMQRQGHGYFPGDKRNLSKRPAPTVAKGGMSAGYELQRVAPSRLKRGSYSSKRVLKSKPSPTITTSSPGNDTPYNDGGIIRKFTIEEVRRICSFPDDFKQEGSYVNQWAVLGNSVPPLMMRAVAAKVCKTLRKIDA